MPPSLAWSGAQGSLGGCNSGVALREERFPAQRSLGDSAYTGRRGLPRRPSVCGYRSADPARGYQDPQGLQFRPRPTRQAARPNGAYPAIGLTGVNVAASTAEARVNRGNGVVFPVLYLRQKSIFWASGPRRRPTPTGGLQETCLPRVHGSSRHPWAQSARHLILAQPQGAGATRGGERRTHSSPADDHRELLTSRIPSI